jgi:hypothetical protein
MDEAVPGSQTQQPNHWLGSALRPGDLQDDDDKPTALGKNWGVYLHRNLAEFLATLT